MANFLDRVRTAALKQDIKPGDLYEDCAYHPVVCVEVDMENDSITGISLVDGSQPRCCSFIHCGVRKLTVEQAWAIRLNGPADHEARDKIGAEFRWWRE